MVKLGAKSTIASLDVDAQYSFTSACPDELPVFEGEMIVTELNKQALFAAFRLGSKEAHPPNPFWEATTSHPAFSPLTGIKNANTYWPKHCVPGTKGFQLIAGLPHPQDYDFFVWKGVEPDMHPYGSCYHDIAEKLSTGLLEFLHHQGIKTVLVGGLATDYCVKTTVLQLLKAGFQIILNLGACRGLRANTTLQAISDMREKGAIIIQSTQELEV
jgi:nicotinamidase/pyrazinamidase